MSDSYVEISEESFGSRLMGSMSKFLFGLLFFLGSFVMLWWNEGNVLATKGALETIKKTVVTVEAETVNPTYDRKVIHTDGEVTGDPVGDPGYLKKGEYILLHRQVEMYQWVEESRTRTEKKLGGKKVRTKTYTYKKEWSNKAHDSSQFKRSDEHQNPDMPIQSEKIAAAGLTLGAFDVDAIKHKLSNSKPLVLEKGMLKTRRFKLVHNALYSSANAASTSPDIGSLKITYRATVPQHFSVIGQQEGSAIISYTDRKTQKHFLMVAAGRSPASQMIKTAIESAGTLAMILRIVGFSLMFFGLISIFSPFTTFLDVIPFVGTLGSFAVGLVSFLISLALSATTIVVAMVAHNPIALVCVIAVSTVGTILWLRNRHAHSDGEISQGRSKRKGRSRQRAA